MSIRITGRKDRARALATLAAVFAWSCALAAQAAPPQVVNESGCSNVMALGGPICELRMGTGDAGQLPGSNVFSTDGLASTATKTSSGGSRPPRTDSTAANKPTSRPVRDRAPEPPTEFQRLAADSVGRVLPIYGQKLFEETPSSFAPLDNVLVPSNYIVGPGDELILQIWGQVNGEQRIVVGSDGQIAIPKVGSIPVAGMPYSELRDYVKREMEKVFRNFDLSVSTGKLHSIDVYVVGRARYPGKYTISSMSTLVNAVLLSGGPGPDGSMRHIHLNRNGQVLSDFDLYDVVQRGDTSKDVRLQSGDVISIGPVGALVAVGGSVNTPAVYELNGSSTIGDLLSLAGGLSEVADATSATVERIDSHKSRKIQEVPLTASGKATEIQGGDVVRVLALVNRFDNAVTLRGNVANPGRYPWHPGEKVSELIPNRESLLTREYWTAQVKSVTGCATEYPVMPAPGQTISLKGAISDTKTAHPADQGGGAAVDPCSRRQVELHSPVADVPDINWEYAVVERRSASDLSPRLIAFSPRRVVLEHDSEADVVLESGDVVTIYSQGDIAGPQDRRAKFVRVEGEVGSPGVYRLNDGETLPELLKRAGGLTPKAYLFGLRLSRESVKQSQAEALESSIRVMEADLQRNQVRAMDALSDQSAAFAVDGVQREIVRRLRSIPLAGRVVLEVHPSEKDLASLPPLVLENEDRVVVPSTPQTVSVVGEVFQQLSFRYRDETRVGSYLRMAGRGTRNSDLRHVLVVRADGSILGAGKSGGVDGAKVLPGDVIVIPSKLETGKWSRAIRDWTQISSQLALSAASMAVISK